MGYCSVLGKGFTRYWAWNSLTTCALQGLTIRTTHVLHDDRQLYYPPCSTLNTHPRPVCYSPLPLNNPRPTVPHLYVAPRVNGPPWVGGLGLLPGFPLLFPFFVFLALFPLTAWSVGIVRDCHGVQLPGSFPRQLNDNLMPPPPTVHALRLKQLFHHRVEVPGGERATHE